MNPRERVLRLPWFMVILAGAVVAGACSPCGAAAAKLKKYTTKHYVLHTDLDKDMTRQAVVRITAMAHEYNNRCKSFAGRINTRFPFYLYKDAEAYRRHPGIIAGSAGVYNGRSLVAIAPRPGGSWRVVQHEGFHQFAHKMIRGHLPTWLNEGLADYFGAGVWTGDRLVVGLISPGSLRRVKNLIKSGKLLPLDKMLVMDQKTWNGELKSSNYLQAWSMVHFLVHGDKGKYQKALSGYIRDLSKGRPSTAAFRKRFGGNTKAFQSCYIKWWNGLEGNPSSDLYDRIKVLTLTNFLARAYYTRREFENVEEFFAAARDGTFTKVFAEIGRRKPTLWLPESLLTRNIPKGGDIEKWSLVFKDRHSLPRLKYTRRDAKALLGAFRLVGRIIVDVGTIRSELEAETKPVETPIIPPELLERL